MSERPQGPAQDQYIQISANIFQCLSQVRPPIDYHFFDEKIGAVKRLHPAGQRVPKELAARMAELCAQGNLFLNKT